MGRSRDARVFPFALLWRKPSQDEVHLAAGSRDDRGSRRKFSQGCIVKLANSALRSRSAIIFFPSTLSPPPMMLFTQYQYEYGNSSALVQPSADLRSHRTYSLGPGVAVINPAGIVEAVPCALWNDCQHSSLSAKNWGYAPAAPAISRARR